MTRPQSCSEGYLIRRKVKVTPPCEMVPLIHLSTVTLLFVTGIAFGFLRSDSWWFVKITQSYRCQPWHLLLGRDRCVFGINLKRYFGVAHLPDIPAQSSDLSRVDLCVGRVNLKTNCQIVILSVWLLNIRSAVVPLVTTGRCASGDLSHPAKVLTCTVRCVTTCFCLMAAGLGSPEASSLSREGWRRLFRGVSAFGWHFGPTDKVCCPAIHTHPC